MIQAKCRNCTSNVNSVFSDICLSNLKQVPGTTHCYAFKQMHVFDLLERYGEDITYCYQLDYSISVNSIIRAFHGGKIEVL